MPEWNIFSSYGNFSTDFGAKDASCIAHSQAVCDAGCASPLEDRVCDGVLSWLSWWLCPASFLPV